MMRMAPIMVTLPGRVVTIVPVPMLVNMDRWRDDFTHGRWMDNHRRRRNHHRRGMTVIVPQRNAEAEPISTRTQRG